MALYKCIIIIILVVVVIIIVKRKKLHKETSYHYYKHARGNTTMAAIVYMQFRTPLDFDVLQKVYLFI